MKRKHIAKLIGISGAHLSMVESGKRRLGAEASLRAGKLLEIDPVIFIRKDLCAIKRALDDPPTTLSCTCTQTPSDGSKDERRDGCMAAADAEPKGCGR